MAQGYRELWQGAGSSQLVAPIDMSEGGYTFDGLIASLVSELKSKHAKVKLYGAATVHIDFDNGSKDEIVGWLDVRRDAGGVMMLYWNGIQAYSISIISTISEDKAREVFERGYRAVKRALNAISA